MYNMARDTYTCDICGFEKKWDTHDDHRGDIWECEDCHTHFCTACFVKALGQAEWDRMIDEMSEIYCQSCYGKDQVRDYMVFEEETSQSYPFPKKYRHMSFSEISRIVDACGGCFDTETVHNAIGAIIGFAEVKPDEGVIES